MSSLFRLDVALIKKHPGLSRRKAREVIEKGQVDVGPERVLDAGRMVPPSADIRWDPNRKARSRIRLDLPLLYSDPGLIVVDKPAGLLAVSTTPEAREDTALARVEAYARRLRPRNPYVGVVHRLDRDTSGALAFALDPALRPPLRALFREHRIERRYVALVAGGPPGDQGIVDLALHEAYEGGRRRVAKAGEASRPALTRWTVSERFEGAALLEVELETGRQHQIRVHLAHIGIPVLGDPVYGADAGGPGLRAPRQMLHARRLAFGHPLTGLPVQAESPLPEDFRRVLARLRGGAGPAARRRG